MIKSKFLIEKVNNKYLDLKAEKYSIKSHNDAVLSCNDEYVELKNSLGKANFDLAKAEYEQDVEKIKNLSTQVEIYEARIKKLALSLNLLPITYACKTCKDTGVYNGKRCKCYYKYLTEYALESLGVAAPENADFENLIQTPELSKQFKIIKNYADNFPNTQFKVALESLCHIILFYCHHCIYQ